MSTLEATVGCITVAPNVNAPSGRAIATLWVRCYIASTVSAYYKEG